MFTGIIEQVGNVEFLRPAGGLSRLRVRQADASWQLSLGESVSVDGVCLTVVSHGAGWFESDCASETLRVTTLGRLGPGHAVNLERALPADGRLGGHFVQGHVDGVADVREVRREGDGRVVSFQSPGAVVPYLVPRGSVAVSGVSLTLMAVSGSRFEVSLIPHTLKVTNLDRLRPGASVNLEADILGKYVHFFLESRGGST